MSAAVMDATGQLAAARLLVDLLERGDLPPVQWNVYAISPGDLAGQISHYSGDLAARLKALSVYAALLGVPVILRRWIPREKGGSLHARGALHGVAVDVWTAVDADELAALDGPELAGTLGERVACSGCQVEMFALPGVPLTAMPHVCPRCAPYTPSAGGI
ncbi:hypothetical protein DQ384_00585 [Sphaerisporangium album]|uniref:Uncharacterized protein n=1 Tax=Sphaerisporangium album TaxID=509200 RepID=A0A367FTG7_9ACTN|nr:hypothetical protein [Sphaerisporangium album]RCG32987.1 hypothetical protein DQ384_00585 [Sphaerisporangium album]